MDKVSEHDYIHFSDLRPGEEIVRIPVECPVCGFRLEEEGFMEFYELPTEIQKTAAHTLHSVLRDTGPNIENESVTKIARTIRTAFIELYQASQGSEKIEITPVNSPDITGTQKPKSLTGEISIEVASEILPVIREAIRRRGLDGNYDYDVMQILKTMVTSLGL